MGFEVYNPRSEVGKWYLVPEYKVMLVRDSGGVKVPSKRIGNPGDAETILRSYLEGADREIFCVMLLNTKNEVIGVNTVSVGGLNSVPVHPREVFKPACIIGAYSIILGHNHPSGRPQPSMADRDITARLVEAGKIMGISILDHVIIAGDTYYSFSANGLI